jgi:hypothetical protein
MQEFSSVELSFINITSLKVQMPVIKPAQNKYNKNHMKRRAKTKNLYSLYCYFNDRRVFFRSLTSPNL